MKFQGMFDIFIVALYIDDLIFTGNNENIIEEFKMEIMKKYEMSDIRILHYFLGIEIFQEDDGVFICQNKYAERILKKFGMYGYNPVSTPLIVTEKLTKKYKGKKIDETRYKSLIGNLFYLTATRPDITFSASLLSRFMQVLSHIHLGATRRVLRYLRGTINYGLQFNRDIEVKLIGFCDSDWGGCLDDMKSTSGYAFSLGSSITNSGIIHS